jgi:hypothetical protein
MRRILLAGVLAAATLLAGVTAHPALAIIGPCGGCPDEPDLPVLYGKLVTTGGHVGTTPSGIPRVSYVVHIPASARTLSTSFHELK